MLSEMFEAQPYRLLLPEPVVPVQGGLDHLGVVIAPERDVPEEVEARSPALDRHHLDEPAREVLPVQLVLQVEVLRVVVVLQAALQQLHHRVLLHPAVDLEHLDCKNARHSRTFDFIFLVGLPGTA